MSQEFAHLLTDANVHEDDGIIISSAGTSRKKPKNWTYLNSISVALDERLVDHGLFKFISTWMWKTLLLGTTMMAWLCRNIGTYTVVFSLFTAYYTNIYAHTVGLWCWVVVAERQGWAAVICAALCIWSSWWFNFFSLLRRDHFCYFRLQPALFSCMMRLHVDKG